MMLSLSRDVSSSAMSNPGSVSAAQNAHPPQHLNSHQQRMLELSTPCSVAPTVVKESAPFDMQQKSRRSLVLKFSNRVPKDLDASDIDFQKLWTILRERGWKYKNGDDVYSNFYLAPNLKVKDARLHSEKFGRAEDLVDFIVRGKDTAFSAVLEEYFRRHPQVLWPSNLQVHDIKWLSLWQILKSLGWKYYTGGLIASHLYAMEGVTKEEAQDRANLGKRSFKTSREATEHILKHQQDFKVVLSEYFEKHPLPEPDDDDEENLSDAEPTAPFSPGFQGHESDMVGNIARKRASAAPPAQPQELNSSNSSNNINNNDSTSNGTSNNSSNNNNSSSNDAKKTNGISFENVDFAKIFNRAWPLLRREFGYGYTHGNSIHTYAFLRPGIGGKRDGVEGRDYFVGEEAFIRHVATELPDLIKDVMADQPRQSEASLEQNQNQNQQSQQNYEKTKTSEHHRLVAPTNEAVPEIAMQETDTAFNYIWPILKNEMYWSHSTGNTLFHYSFLRPGLARKSDGIEGRDYFMGEAALLAHVRKVYPHLVRRYFSQKNDSASSTAPQAGPLCNKQKMGVPMLKKKSQQSLVFDNTENQEKHKQGEDKQGEEEEEDEQKETEDQEHWQQQQQQQQEQQQQQAKQNEKAAQHRLAQESRKTKKRLFEASALVCGLTTTTTTTTTSGASRNDNGDSNHVNVNNSTQVSLSTGNAQCSIDFNSVWPHLQELGWKFFQGSGLASFYYAKPHVQRKSDGKLGIDMFDTEAAVVKEYISYIENLEKNSDDANANAAQKQQVCDLDEQQAGGNSPDTAPDLDYDLDFGNFAWDVLRTEHGWIYKSGNKLYSYCFLKPPLTKKGDGVEGVNLFLGYRALCKYVKANHPEIMSRYRMARAAQSKDDGDDIITSSLTTSTHLTKRQEEQQPPKKKVRHGAPPVNFTKSPEANEPTSSSTVNNTSASVSSAEISSGNGEGLGYNASPSAGAVSNKALFDFIWGKLKQEGWSTAFVQRAPDGSMKHVLVSEEELLQHVCTSKSNLILEYAKEQKQ